MPQCSRLLWLFALFMSRPCNLSGYGAVSSADQPKCPMQFETQAECSKCKFVSYELGFLPDRCDVFMFYECIKDGDLWRANHMPCGPCSVWSHDSVTCTSHPGVCTSAKTPGGYVEVIGKEMCRKTNKGGKTLVRLSYEDPLYYVVDDYGVYTVEPCQPGTTFSLTTCECSLNTRMSSEPDEEITCIDFDSAFGQAGFSAPSGHWVKNTDVSLSEDGVKGKSGYFNGEAKLEIPEFANKYNYKRFTVSLWFKRTSGSSDVMGLLSNGACAQEGSLEMLTDVFTDDSVGMRAASDASINSTTFYADILPGYWHHIAIVYDYNKVTYFVDDDQPVTIRIAPGSLANRPCPLTLGLIGQDNYLKGHMDQICLFKTALTKEQVRHLYQDADFRRRPLEI